MYANAFMPQMDGLRGTIEWDDSWYQGRSLFGGIQASALLAAMQHQTELPPRAFSAQFVQPLQQGPTEVHVDVLREGRRLTQIRAELRQGSRVGTVGIASFGERVDGDPIREAAPAAPSFPPIEQTRRLPPNPPMPRFTQHIDFRYLMGGIPFHGKGEPSIGGYCRVMGPAPQDAMMWLTLLDAWPPISFSYARGVRAGATIDMSVVFFKDAPGGVGEDFYTYRANAAEMSGGFFEEDRWLWAPDGTPVARMRQHGIMV